MDLTIVTTDNLNAERETLRNVHEITYTTYIHLQPVSECSSIIKARNRTTIPALLFNQNIQIRTQSKCNLSKLFHARPLTIFQILSGKR